MSRKTLFLLTLVMALSTLVSAVWAVQLQEIDVTGNFFNPKPGATQLCAQVYPFCSNAQVQFTGKTPYDTEVTAQYVWTNAWGKACIKTIWPQGIYKVKARARYENSTSGSILQVPCIKSDPVAVSVFNPKNFCGAQGGGALYLRSYDVPPNVKTTLAARQATFAFIVKRNQPNNFGILFFDNDNPYGQVEFESIHWFDSNILYYMGPDYASIELIGMGEAEVNGQEQPVHYYMYADTFPGANKFYLELRDITGALIYKSSPTPTDPEAKVFNGKNLIVPCENDEDWPCGDC